MASPDRREKKKGKKKREKRKGKEETWSVLLMCGMVTSVRLVQWPVCHGNLLHLPQRVRVWVHALNGPCQQDLSPSIDGRHEKKKFGRGTAFELGETSKVLQVAFRGATGVTVGGVSVTEASDKPSNCHGCCTADELGLNYIGGNAVTSGMARCEDAGGPRVLLAWRNA